MPLPKFPSDSRFRAKPKEIMDTTFQWVVVIELLVIIVILLVPRLR